MTFVSCPKPLIVVKVVYIISISETYKYEHIVAYEETKLIATIWNL